MQIRQVTGLVIRRKQRRATSAACGASGDTFENARPIDTTDGKASWICA